MVFAFLSHSLASIPRVFYSAVYGDDLQIAAGEGTPVDSLRSIRKEQLMVVACRVQSEYGMRMAARDSTDESPQEKGLFRLSPGDPFSTAKVVIWHVRDDCAYVFVCELDENRLQAESILSTLTRLIQEHVTSYEQKNAEIMLKAEKVTAILHQFLPNGQLLFLNHRAIIQYEKRLEKLLSGK